MATFLITPQMNPALRARVERAVSHRRRAKAMAAKLGLQGTVAGRERWRLARLIPLVLMVLVGLLGWAVIRKARREMEQERSALLAIIEERRAALPAGHEKFLGVTDHLITEAAADTAPPDSVDPSLKGAGALDAMLKRSAVYVHGSAADLADSQKIDGVAKESDKDGFLHCLASPPDSASEKDLLAKVKGVYFQGAKVDEETASVRRLADARVPLRVINTSFEAQVRAAEEGKTLRLLRHELEIAPIDKALRAVGAEVLIIVADVTAKTGSREARVAFLDLKNNAVLFRKKVHVDGQGRTTASSFYSAEVDGCAMALSVRQSLAE